MAKPVPGPEANGDPVFPKEAYQEQFIEELLHRVYKLGQVPTREENLFLLSLKSHPSAIQIASRLLGPGGDLLVHQFAATFLTQILQSSPPESFGSHITDHLISLISKNSSGYGEDPLGRKIRRQLMMALGILLRPLANWQTKFQELVQSIQPDFFHSLYPNPVALDVFYVFVKFELRRSGEGGAAFHLVIQYFSNLLEGHFAIFTEQQAFYLKFLGDWLRDVEEFDTPGAEVGKLMVQVAKYVDCPERQIMPWSAVQIEAANTLEVFLGLTDLHLLQNSILELLQVIVAYPIVGRAQTIPNQQVLLYLDTTVKVFLHFTLEFADVVIACSENPASRHLLLDFLERLKLLADPFPDRESLSPLEGNFSSDAVAAFAELSSLMFQMCGLGSDVAEALRPYLKSFFGVLVKKASQPPKSVISSWSHDEQDRYREMRRDVQKAVEHLALAVGNNIYSWIEDEFSDAIRIAESTGSLVKLATVCWVFRFSYSSMAPSSPSFRVILGQLHKVLSTQDRDCIFQAFKALECWIPALEDSGYEDILVTFVPVFCTALAVKDASLTNMCVGSLAVIIEALPKHISASYLQVSEGISGNLTGVTGSLSSRGVLLKCLGHLITKLPPNQAATEIEKVFPIFSIMLSSSTTPKDLSDVISIFPGFFRAIGADTVEIRLSVHAVVHDSVARLGTRLLSHLHEAGILNVESEASQKLDSVCSVLINDILYACGPAIKDLLPAVVPIVGRFFTRNPQPAVLNLVTELLTVHLNGVEYNDLFSQLCTYVFKSVIALSTAEKWTDFSDVFASFVLMAYPVIRSNGNALVRLDIDWEGLLNLVIKLLLLLPISGDSESHVRANLIFEELLRMKPRDASQIPSFVNPIKAMLEGSYGLKLVQQFLTIFYDSCSDEQRVKMCADCLFVMLTEMGVLTKSWLRQVATPVVETDPIQHMAYDRLLSTIITQRSRKEFWVALKMENRRNTADKLTLESEEKAFVADIKMPGDLPLPAHDLCHIVHGRRKSRDLSADIPDHTDVIFDDKMVKHSDQIISLGPVEGADKQANMPGGNSDRPTHHRTLSTDISGLTETDHLDPILEVSEKKSLVIRAVESVAAAAGTVAGIFSSSKSSVEDELREKTELQTDTLLEDQPEKGLVDTAIEKVWNVLTGKEELFPQPPQQTDRQTEEVLQNVEKQNGQHQTLNADAPVFVPHGFGLSETFPQAQFLAPEQMALQQEVQFNPQQGFYEQQQFVPVQPFPQQQPQFTPVQFTPVQPQFGSFFNQQQ